jgi:chromate transporter
MSGAVEVFRVFLRLGFTSFGGPVAHLGYFRAEFVARRRWLDDSAFADLVALCQFLPGPASSQVAFALGLLRAGYWGAVAAWTAFTLPSAVALVAFAFGARGMHGRLAEGALHGLKLAAAAIVAQAVLGMARTLCPDRERAGIAALALALVALAPGILGQLVALVVGGALCLAFRRGGEAAPVRDHAPSPVSRRAGLGFLVLFFALLALSFLPSGGTLELFSAFYRSGALVFGGGHVVLPLLRDAVVAPGWISESDFLAGYGAAQAVPGPLFTLSAYLGAAASVGPGGILGAGVALVGLSLPGLVVVTGALPFWRTMSASVWARAAMAGLNAAIVGLLASALYDPVFVGAVRSTPDFAAAAAGFVALVAWKAPPLAVVVFCALAGMALD